MVPGMSYGVSRSGRTSVFSGRQPSSVSSRYSDCACNNWKLSGNSSTLDCPAVDSAENHEAASTHNTKDIFLFIGTFISPTPSRTDTQISGFRALHEPCIVFRCGPPDSLCRKMLSRHFDVHSASVSRMSPSSLDSGRRRMETCFNPHFKLSGDACRHVLSEMSGLHRD